MYVFVYVRGQPMRSPVDLHVLFCSCSPCTPRLLDPAGLNRVGYVRVDCHGNGVSSSAGRPLEEIDAGNLSSIDATQA